MTASNLLWIVMEQQQNSKAKGKTSQRNSIAKKRENDKEKGK